MEPIDPKELLERMASISPGVRLHLTGRLWLENIDEDEITDQMLVNECFALMIGEAYEIGIEFYCTLSDLCESFYVIDQTLILFEVIFPTPLYKNITESDAFRKMISAVVVDGADVSGESSIQTIMEHLGVNNPSTTEVFSDTYLFLQDKMKSTPVFDIYAQSILDVDNTPIATEINDVIIKSYLDSVQKIITNLLNATDILMSKASELLPPNASNLYDAVNEYKVKAVDANTLWTYAWAYDMRHQDGSYPVVQALVEKYRIQFCASVPFFEEYYELRDVSIERFDLVLLLLGSYIQALTDTHEMDKDVCVNTFLSTSKNIFDRLRFVGKIDLIDVNLFIQKISLVLVQEISRV